MSNDIHAETQELEGVGGPLQYTSINLAGTLMAVASCSLHGATRMQVHESAGAVGWHEVAAWDVEDDVVQLTWAHSEFGRVFAAASSSGSTAVWGHSPAAAAMSDDGAACPYQLLAQLRPDAYPARAIAFAPRQLGLVLGILQQGSVYVYEAGDASSSQSWSLHSKLQVGAPEESTSFCWRPFSPGAPPMICAASGPQACIWQYVRALNSWQQVAVFESPDGSQVSCVDWAEPLGRPMELIALGARTQLAIYGASGETSALAVRQLDVLDHEDDVYQVQWDALGNQVAAGTEGPAGGAVHVYIADLNGSWRRLVLADGCS